jgi:hypothetical protein
MDDSIVGRNRVDWLRINYMPSHLKRPLY